MARHIQNKIRFLRFENGEMTQEQLANLAKVTRQTIAAIENNKYSPSLELAFKIADAFEMPLCNVFSYGSGENFEDVHKNKGGGPRKRNGQNYK